MKDPLAGKRNKVKWWPTFCGVSVMGEADRDRITIWFTDGTCVRLESEDFEGYRSWIAVLETRGVAE